MTFAVGNRKGPVVFLKNNLILFADLADVVYEFRKRHTLRKWTGLNERKHNVCVPLQQLMLQLRVGDQQQAK